MMLERQESIWSTGRFEGNFVLNVVAVKVSCWSCSAVSWEDASSLCILSYSHCLMLCIHKPATHLRAQNTCQSKSFHCKILPRIILIWYPNILCAGQSAAGRLVPPCPGFCLTRGHAEAICALNVISLETRGYATCSVSTGSAVLAVYAGVQNQLRYCWWYRSSHGTDFDVSGIANPV